MIHIPFFRYSAPGNAIRGQSYRVVLDGGLSPLRFDGGKKEGTISLALANSGAAVKTNVSEATAKRNFFKNLPQKVREK